MSTDYSKMSDFEINKLVALASGKNIKFIRVDVDGNDIGVIVGQKYTRQQLSFDPCNNPADAWPIITANKISIYAMSEIDGRGCWGAEAFYPNESYHFNDNPLRAAMIVFLMMQESKNAS